MLYGPGQIICRDVEILLITGESMCFLISCQSYFLNYLSQIFYLQFIVFSVGVYVCTQWVQWQGLMTISSEEGDVQPVSASV